MTVGQYKTQYLGMQGEIRSGTAPSYDFLKDTYVALPAGRNVGDRVELPSGKVFRLAKAGAAIATTDLAVSFAAATKITAEAFAAVSLINTNTVFINEAGITADQLRGGEIIIYRNGYSTHFNCGILGNTASDGSNNVTVYLDMSLPYALTTSDTFELMLNPWSDLRQTNFGGRASFAGMPVVTVASGSYFWVQTYGPVWCAPQSGVGASAYVRSVYFRHDGSLDIRANIGTYVTDQLAGFVIEYDASAQGPPLVMLTVCK
jgi:hypothetical protein